MGILDKLKPQPRWKHADPAVRLDAIRDLDDAAEMAVLAESDPDPEVRRAALARIDDPGILGRATTDDADAGAQECAAERLFFLAMNGVDGTALRAVEAIADPKRLSAIAKSDTAEAVCQAALARTSDERALGSIARHAKHSAVATAALERLADPAELKDVALTADQKDVAVVAFDRLFGPDADREALQAVEAAATQKAVAKRARARIQEIEAAEAARLEAEEARRRQAATLAEAVEKLTDVADEAAVEAELARLAESWQQLGEASQPMQARFDAARAAVDEAQARRRREAEEAAERARLQAEAAATREALCARVETLDGDDVLEQLVPIEEEWRSLLPLVGNGPEADRLAERFAVAVAACRKRHELGAKLAETRASLDALVMEAESLPSNDDAAAAAARWVALNREARGLTALLSDALRPAPEDLVSRLDAVGAVFAARETERRAAVEKTRADLLAKLERLAERAGRAHEADSITLREGDRLMRDVKHALEALARTESTRELDAAANKVRSLQEKVAPRVRELREMDDWRRFANAQRQEQLIAMAEAIVASLKADEEAGKESDLPATGRALRELHAQWREVAEAPRQSAQRLWDRFRAATDYIRSRCEVHFAHLREERAENLTQRTAIVEEAESLAESTNWVKTAARFGELQDAWKQIGPVPRDAGRELAQRFRVASNAFFARRREDMNQRKKTWAENLAAKEALCEKAEALAESTEWDSAVRAMKQLQAEWKTIGPVRRNKSDAIWARFRAAADTFFDRYHRRHEIALSSKLAEREALVVQIEELSASQNGHVPPDLAARVQELRTTWNRSVPIPAAGMKPLAERWETAFRQLVEKRADAFANTELDPARSREKMLKLVERVEALLDAGQESQAALSPTEQLAAKLRSALASNAMGGRANEQAKWRSAVGTVREAQASWNRLVPVPGPDGEAMTARVEQACRRVLDEARQHGGGDARRPKSTARPSRPARKPRGRRPKAETAAV
jgi:hypothetical protein